MTGSSAGATTSDVVDADRAALPWPSVSRRGMHISRGGGGTARRGRACACDRRGVWATAYELSTDLRDKQREALARRYGGATTAGRAAAVIQHAYRRHCMARNFAKLRLAADERWRRGAGGGGGPLRPLSSRSQTVWSDMAATVAALDDERRPAAAARDDDADGLACISEYDVMSHSYSADNMLQHCATLTRRRDPVPTDPGDAADRELAAAVTGDGQVRRRYRQPFEGDDSVVRDPAEHDDLEAVVVVARAGGGQVRYLSSGDSNHDCTSSRSRLLTDPRDANPELAAVVSEEQTRPTPRDPRDVVTEGQVRYLSSGDSSDDGTSPRASPLPLVDPTSADFETVLEAANVDSDDSFSSEDDAAADESDEDAPADLAMSSSLVRRRPQSPVSSDADEDLDHDRMMSSSVVRGMRINYFVLHL